MDLSQVLISDGGDIIYLLDTCKVIYVDITFSGEASFEPIHVMLLKYSNLVTLFIYECKKQLFK